MADLLIFAAPLLMLAMLFCGWQALQRLLVWIPTTAFVSRGGYSALEQQDDFWHGGGTIDAARLQCGRRRGQRLIEDEIRFTDAEGNERCATVERRVAGAGGRTASSPSGTIPPIRIGSPPSGRFTGRCWPCSPRSAWRACSPSAPSSRPPAAGWASSTFVCVRAAAIVHRPVGIGAADNGSSIKSAAAPPSKARSQCSRPQRTSSARVSGVGAAGSILSSLWLVGRMAMSVTGQLASSSRPPPSSSGSAQPPGPERRRAAEQGQRRLHELAAGIARLPLGERGPVGQRQPGRMFDQGDVPGRPREQGGEEAGEQGPAHRGAAGATWKKSRTGSPPPPAS